MSKISFNIIQTDRDYQIIEIFIPGSGIMSPVDLKGLELPAEIDYTKGSIISGKAPVWLFAYLNHKLHIAKWVATYDPRVGAIVVQSHGVDSPQPGDIIPNDEILKYLNRPEEIKKKDVRYISDKKIIALVGPPHSGKSVLLFNLKEHLQKSMSDTFQNDFFILRACPDGEGDWFGEISEELGKIIRYKKMFDDEFVNNTIESIHNLSKTKKMLFVDLGGKIDKINQKILNECSHAILVSKDDRESNEWRGALKLCGVVLLAEINSVHEDVCEKIDENKFKIGFLERGGKRMQLPNDLIKLLL